MKEKVFVDTGYWIALIDKRDQNHTAAKQVLQPLLTSYEICLSDFVIFETLTYLNCSIKRHDLAIKYLEKMENPNIHVFTVDEAIKNKAIHLFKKYSDKDFSIADCTSFTIMQVNNIKLFAGFDDHFKQMSFISIMPE